MLYFRFGYPLPEVRPVARLLRRLRDHQSLIKNDVGAIGYVAFATSTESTVVGKRNLYTEHFL